MKDKKECQCNKSYPNPEHGEVCVNCGGEIWETAEKKVYKKAFDNKFSEAMEEMECFSVQNHLKNCKKCSFQLLKAQRQELKKKVEEVIGEDEEVSDIRVTAEVAEAFGKVTQASEGRNKLRSEQRIRLINLLEERKE